MNYSLNPNELSSFFALPSSVVEKHIKLASEYQIKALLIFVKNQSDEDVKSTISKKLSLSENEVEECLDYWVQRGVLVSDKKKKKKEKVTNTVVETVSTAKPTREEAVKRIADSGELKFLSDVVQQKLSRPITTAEMKTLVWLYDCYGLPVEVIVMAIEYAVNSERLNFSYIEKVCVNWAKNDITTLQQAEEKVNELYLSKTAWNIVRSAFGIEKRKPSAAEQKYADKWINTFEFNKDMLVAAYDICINQTSKYNAKYINTILESWHKEGYKKPSDIQAKQDKPKSNRKNTSYSIDDIKKKMNNFD